MDGRTDIELARARLPPELVYVYLLAPVLFAPVFRRSFFDLPAAQMLLAVAENALPFWGIPAVLHAVYRWVLPHFGQPTRSIAARMIFHAFIGVLVAVPVSMLVRPLLGLAHPSAPPVLGFASACVVITWTLVLPALLVEELRTRSARAEQRLAEQQQATLRVQLEALQSRTQPHFLFNALNTVAALIPEQPELAERTVERIADMLRYTLRSARTSKVPLSSELRMMGDYLEIQQARFGSRLRYVLDVEAGTEQFEVPPLLLQPLVENAVLHGIATRALGGEVRVQVRLVAGRLEVRVEDGGEGERSKPLSPGTGTSLRDLQSRLELVYGATSAMKREPNLRGGMTVDLCLPSVIS
jgi:two-component system, LytTR family, sensor histidine kinase AlgZ